LLSHRGVYFGGARAPPRAEVERDIAREAARSRSR
jgi:hypothetical protein